MKISTKQYAQSLFDVMKSNNDLEQVEKVIQDFLNLYNREKQILEVEVISTRKLDEKQMEDVKNFVAKKYEAKEIILKNLIDESILGGLCLKIGDEMTDLSVSGQLKKLRENLKS